MSGHESNVERDVELVREALEDEVGRANRAAWEALDRLTARVREQARETGELTHDLLAAQSRVRELEEARLQLVQDTDLNWRNWRAAEAENARLREALERILWWAENKGDERVETRFAEIFRIARAALADPFLPIGHETC